MYHHIAKTMRSFNNGESLYFRFQISYPKIDMPCEIRGSHVGVANCMICEEWSTTFLRNVRSHLRNDTLSHSIRSEFLQHVVYCGRSSRTCQKIMPPSSEYIRSKLLHHAVYCGRNSRTFQKIVPPSSEYVLGGGLNTSYEDNKIFWNAGILVRDCMASHSVGATVNECGNFLWLLCQNLVGVMDLFLFVRSSDPFELWTLTDIVDTNWVKSVFWIRTNIMPLQTVRKLLY